MHSRSFVHMTIDLRILQCRDGEHAWAFTDRSDIAGNHFTYCRRGRNGTTGGGGGEGEEATWPSHTASFPGRPESWVPREELLHPKCSTYTCSPPVAPDAD